MIEFVATVTRELRQSENSAHRLAGLTAADVDGVANMQRLEDLAAKERGGGAVTFKLTVCDACY